MNVIGLKGQKHEKQQAYRSIVVFALDLPSTGEVGS